jgi:NADPH-dependent 2,4-dienoyl-CoA reductase/sulfur reductase-like enzyme/rhodanese-related sulfurtransferase
MDELVPYTPARLKAEYNIDVHTEHEITEIDHDKKMIYGKNLATNDSFEDDYDVLVFANGTNFGVPPVFRGKEFSNVFQVKNVERGRQLQRFIEENSPKTAVIVGTGYIGLGVSEQLTNTGIKVTTVDFLKYPMAVLDHDISTHIADILEENGVAFYGDEGVVELKENGDRLESVLTSKGNEFAADMFIVATGVRPNTELAQSIGVETGETRAIKVNERMETNISDVYAIGDVAEAYNVITKEPMYLPLATTATKMGRIAGDAITGGDLEFRGILGTSAVRLFGKTIASTGMTELKAREKGIEPIVLTNIKPDKLTFMGGKYLLIKAIADPETEQLLGVQIIGEEGAERRIDVFATAMTLGAKVSDLFHLDLAFTPPISTPKDPVMQVGMALTNAAKDSPLITPEELIQLKRDIGNEIQLIDVRRSEKYDEGHIFGANNIPFAELREKLDTFNKDDKIVIYDNSGDIGYNAQCIFKNNGFTNVKNLSGGFLNYLVALKDYEKHSSN